MPIPGDFDLLGPLRGKRGDDGGLVPSDPYWYNPVIPPGYTPPPEPPIGNPTQPNTPVVEPGSTNDPVGEWVRTLLPPQKSQRVSSKLVGANPGTADLTGVGDLLANLSFQRLWDSYNPGKSTDYMSSFQAPNAITAAQGDPGGHIWGYIDPTWLPGFNPGVRKTTIEEILTPMYKDVWRELPAAEKVEPPAVPPQRGPNNDRTRKPLPI